MLIGFHSVYNNSALKYFEGAISKCKELGYVESIAGRKRYIPDIVHTDQSIKSAAERMARNTIMQSSAADVIKISMVKIQSQLATVSSKTHLVHQMHDELVNYIKYN